MYDTLHIVIQQDPSRGGRRGRGVPPSQPRHHDPKDETTLPLPDDPKDETTMPLPDDPKDETTMPLPDDPKDETTLPLPDDPHLRWGGPGTVSVFGGPPAGYGHAAGCGCGCGCGCSCDDGQPVRPEMQAGDYSGFVIVRVAASVDLKDLEDLWQIAVDNHLGGLQAVLELEQEWKAEGAVGGGGETANGGETSAGGETAAGERLAPAPPPHLRNWPLIAARGCLDRAAVVEKLRRLEDTARKGCLPPLHRLESYWQLDMRSHPDKAQEVVDRLNALAEVDLAYRELVALDPGSNYAPPAALGTRFAEDQGYLDDAPVGIGARWAWSQLPSSPGSHTLCDLEQRWNPGHQDLPPHLDEKMYYGANRDSATNEGGDGNHGTAVLGQLAAVSNAAVDGGAAPVADFTLSSHYLGKDETSHPFAGTNGHVAAAIVYALLDQGGDAPEPLAAGEVLLLEVQRAGLLTEVHAADFDAIRLASSLGVIVVEAAGNGNRDLDAYVDPDTGFSLRRGSGSFRDSGAIVVGAAWSVLPHDRSPFSNHGSRLDCFAWGDSVTSCGYGDLAGDQADDYYTNTFSGTSSASPIIAAAAALVQALHPATLDPLQMRTLLSNPATGTAQGPGTAGFIGYMPDLRALVRDELQLVPLVYLRHHPGDIGGRPSKEEAVSSSPDLMVLAQGKAPKPWYQERAYQPAAGGQAVPGGGPYDLRVRLRNRGMGTGTVAVRAFASPAATLIPPEHWRRIPEPAVVQDVAQGDTPVIVATPISFAPPSVAPLPAPWNAPPPLSLLAVARPPGPAPSDWLQATEEHGDWLPPSGAWFDWGGYRRFLRSPGVAWRNVFHVGESQRGNIPFLLAGAPDRDRRFSLEVVQRLPAGAAVFLDLPSALAAKLVQAQPLLARVSTSAGIDRLRVPGRPRTAMHHVALPAGCRSAVAFAVELGQEPLGSDHSLALRQLWRGEEVGRITWYFRVPATGPVGPGQQGGGGSNTDPH